VTLPGHFKQQGYHTRGLGKLFHFADDNNPEPFDAAKSCWSEPHWSPPDGWPGVRQPDNIAKIKQAQRRNPHIFSIPWEFDDCEDNGYPDGRTCEQAVKDLARLKEADKPFFLAVGFAKPHLPFTAPKKILGSL
jgi:iduronate 2-sulfatase